MPRLIIKSQGQEHVCLYDKADHDLISRHTWSLQSEGYATTTIDGKKVLMHRMILGVIDHPEIEVDHIYHNKLDNRRSQVRICTRSENRRNSRKFRGTSKYKGVYNDLGLFHAQISVSGCVCNLGRYYSEATAAKVYDAAAREEFQEFALLNFPEYVQPQQLTMNLK